MNSLSSLWGETTVVCTTLEILKITNVSSGKKHYSPRQLTLAHSLSPLASTLPRMPDPCSLDSSQPWNTPLPLQYSSASVLSSMGDTSTVAMDDVRTSFNDNSLYPEVNPGLVTSDLLPQFHHHSIHPTPSPEITESILPVPELRLLAAHYLWEARRNFDNAIGNLDTNMGALVRVDQGIPGIISSMKNYADRLFLLLPLSRLCDYISPSDTTIANLEEAATVAALLLNLVEDLYMACVGQPVLKGDRGPVVSLDRYRKLEFVFPELSEESKTHLNFLEACITTGCSACSSVEEALRSVLLIRPMRSVLSSRIHFRDLSLNSGFRYSVSADRTTSFCCTPMPASFAEVTGPTAPPSELASARSLHGVRFNDRENLRCSFINSPTPPPAQPKSQEADPRDREVERVALSNLYQHLEYCGDVYESRPSENMPTEFIVNDYLIMHMLEDVMLHLRQFYSSELTVMVHRCGLHLVVDLIPSSLVPESTSDKALLAEEVSEFYQQQEARMKPDKPAESSLFEDTSLSSPLLWIDEVISTSFLVMPNPFAPTFGSFHQTQLGGWATSEELSDGLRYVDNKSFPSPKSDPSPRSSGVVDLPKVWATHAGPFECCVVNPTKYLSLGVCYMLAKIKAAVVMSNTGAATLAFPYITQDRLTLLKDMGKVYQPFSAAADLGIVELNRMAEEAALEYCTQVREDERRGDVVSLGYDTAVGRMTDGMLEASVNIPSLAKLLKRQGAADGVHSPVAADVASPIGGTDSVLGSPVTSPMYGFPLLVSDQASGGSLKNIINTTEGSAVSANRSDNDAAASISKVEEQAAMQREDFDTSQKEFHDKALDFNAASVDDAILNISAFDNQSVAFGAVRCLFYVEKPCDKLIDLLISYRYGVTTVTSKSQMEGILFCGIQSYELIIVEWSASLIDDSVVRLLAKARSQAPTVPVFYYILESVGLQSHVSAAPPQPNVESHFLLTGPDLYTACFSHRPTIVTHTRIGRLTRHLQAHIPIRYLLREKIGCGAFADVSEVMLCASREKLAMKRIQIKSATRGQLEQLYKEATIMRALDHRNIVQLAYMRCTEDELLLFMERCDCTLKNVVDEGVLHVRQTASDPRSPPCNNPSQSVVKTAATLCNNNSFRADSVSSSYTITGLYVVRDILSGVKCLHDSNIVHRDLKPLNILFLNGVAKLADFGSATTLTEKKKSLRSMKGTVSHMAPEVFLGKPYGKPCDLWSMGVIIGDILGLHFAHTALLHFPALRAYYKSFDPDESMPVVITNFINKGHQKHFTDELVNDVETALQEARKVAREERNSGTSPRQDKRRYSIAPVTTERTVFIIEVDSREESCKVSKCSFPTSLVELLESTFRLDPEKRVTAEELLLHPCANEKDWVPRMLEAVLVTIERFQMVRGMVDSMGSKNLTFGCEDDDDSSDDVF